MKHAGSLPPFEPAPGKAFLLFLLVRRTGCRLLHQSLNKNWHRNITVWWTKLPFSLGLPVWESQSGKRRMCQRPEIETTHTHTGRVITCYAGVPRCLTHAQCCHSSSRCRSRPGRVMRSKCKFRSSSPWRGWFHRRLLSQWRILSNHVSSFHPFLLKLPLSLKPLTPFPSSSLLRCSSEASLGARVQEDSLAWDQRLAAAEMLAAFIDHTRLCTRPMTRHVSESHQRELVQKLWETLIFFFPHAHRP